MKRSLSILASVVLAFGGVVATAPIAQAAPQDTIKMRTITESRSLAHLTNFQAEADERAVRIYGQASLSSSQYAAIGSGKKLTMTMSLKNGGAVVARETSVNVDGAISNYSWGSNTFITNSSVGSVTLNATLEANLLPSTNYQVLVEIFVDGVLKTITTDYTLGSFSGTFNKVGKSIVADGTENTLNFDGQTCLSSTAYSTLVAGDVLEFEVTDSAAHTYGSYGYLFGNGGTSTYFQWNNSTSKYEATVTSSMLSDKVWVSFNANSNSVSAGTYDPSVSIKKAGSATELTAECVTAPSVAPTLTATATGLSMTVDPSGASSVRCFIADARYPSFWVRDSSTYGTQTTCSFFGLKQGNYVGWYERRNNVSQTNYSEVRSDYSPLSASVAYTGGNGTYRTFTGTTGGSGQGSLTLTNIDYAGSDFQTESRVSDGNGGLLVGSSEAGDDQIKIRQLTPTGMSSSFGGSGVVTVNLPPVNYRAGTPQVAWYGTGRDKWMALVNLPSPQTYDQYGGVSSVTVLATGDYAGNTQSTSNISSTDLGRFCQANVTGQDNSTTYAYIRQLISAPTADPLLVVSCDIRHGNSGSYYSQVPFLVTFSGGQFVAKAALGDEPTSAEKCSFTVTSAVNSGATGSEVMLAAYQRTWNPANTECYLYNSLVPSANVVSRDIFTVTAGYTRTAIRDVMTVTDTNEPALGSSGMGASAQARLIVSGPNTHMLTSEVSGSSPNQVTKYRIARLTNGSFGTYEQQPYLNVASTDSFSQGTNLTQIADYSENEAASVLLSRSDYATGSTAARVDLTTGTMTSYQQMASAGSMGMTDGGSTILGNSTGDLNFYGITSRSTAVLGQWVTTGAFDSALSALPINQGASNTGVSQGNPSPNPGPQQGPAAAPYTGPVVEAPGATRTITKGMKLKLDGSNLTSVTKVTIDGKDAKVKVNSAGEIEITIPSDLAGGTYDLVVTSDSGLLTIQDAIKISDSSVDTQTSPVNPSTRLKEDNTVKVYVFDVLGAGKIQLFFNGKEVAWINADDINDPKLTNDYLVRTLNLLSGKNIIEIYVDGKRVDRKAYTKVDDDSRI